IADRITAAFPESVRERGTRYQREGRVRLLRAGGGRLEAIVRGTVAYQVEIVVNGRGDVNVLCSCPYSQEHVVCKHSWATLLEAAVHGSLPAALAEGALG